MEAVEKGGQEERKTGRERQDRYIGRKEDWYLGTAQQTGRRLDEDRVGGRQGNRWTGRKVDKEAGGQGDRQKGRQGVRVTCRESRMQVEWGW